MTKRLYKYDSGGKLRVWFMTQLGNTHTTTAGLADGALTTSAPTHCVGKQRRSDEEQAAFEVESGYTYQLKREYFLTPEEAAGDARFFKPMLAEKWQDIGWTKGLALIQKATRASAVVGTGIYSQPKFDGFCCIAQASGMTSREGQPIVSAPHVMSALAQFFAENPEASLHGELYNHDLKDDFEGLSSVLKKQKPDADDLARSAQLAQFHVYDYPSEAALPFSERSRLLALDLERFVGPVIHLAETIAVSSELELEGLRIAYIDDGYEGQIVRLDLPYEQKRSKSVLKNKVFDDAEFKVVSIMEGKGNYAGYAKRVLCELPDGRAFGAGIRGKKAFLAALLKEEHAVVTIRHFGMTGDGIPRMGVATKWHGAGRTL